MPPEPTPMMQQYRRAKAEAPDALLFFRLGDFYEMFFEDAVEASRILDITLTARGRDQADGGYPMCGVPVHAADGYLARLVKAGRKVAVCEQVEDPRQAKGIVRREVVRIVSPGTAMDEGSLEPRERSFITAIFSEPSRIGLAHVEVSTGEVRYSEHDPRLEGPRVVTELAAFAPREVLVPDSLDRRELEALFPGQRLPAVTTLDPSMFARQLARERISERWNVAGLSAFGLEARPGATRAVGAVLGHVADALRANLSHLEPPRLVDSGLSVGLDPATIRNLELLESLADRGKEGTLASVLDRTVTASGGRTLRSWLVAPLRDPAAIDERLDAVEALAADEAAGRGLAQALEGVADLERLVARAVIGTATPRCLAALAASLGRLPALKERLAASSAALLRALAAGVDPLDPLRTELAETMEPEPPATARDGGLIRPGRSPELDELRSIARDARTHLARLEAKEREASGIASLKIRHNRVFGYYLEVTQANLAKVPADWQRRQTLSTGERFTTDELKELEGRIVNAQDRSVALEQEMFASLVSRVAGEASSLRRTGRDIGAIDALASFAAVAARNRYVRPVVDESCVLEIRAGRHPVVEQLRGEPLSPSLGDGRFVPNDTLLDAASRQLVVLTGPNMGGKSTYLRQVALIVLMAQAGSFVPAESARVGVVDRIFTRVGASDYLARGQSTFMVEMIETARILNEATARSLVVLDEIGRGTSTFDGLSIAWAVSEYIHETPRVAARTLFATHYHELTELSALYPRVVNLRMATREWKGDIVFLHRVEEGEGDRSYGIQVARLAGIPAPVIARAKEVLENLLRSELDPSGQPRLARHEGQGPPPTGPRTLAPQLPLFGEPAEDPRARALRDRLAILDVDALTPRQALDVLADLQAEARRIVGA